MMTMSSLNAFSSTRNRLGSVSIVFASAISLVLFITIPRIAVAQTADNVLATVDGEPITQQQVDFLIANQLFSLQQQIYALQNASLQNLIARKTLEIEARRVGLTPDQLKQKIMAGDVTVSPEQIESLYQKNATAFGLMSQDEVREKLRLDLEAQARVRKYRDQIAKLREAAHVEIFLAEPRVQPSSPVDSFASLGQSNARVVLTEFSDFQCPYCKSAQGVLHRIVEAYPRDVRLEFRNLPLEMHPFALLAAKAGHCAGKQKKFWVYHDALFALPNLDSTSIEKVANEVGIDRNQFQTCLSSEEAQHSVGVDVNEAVRLGIDSTPTLLINGRQYRGSIQFDDLKEQIEHELETSLTLTPQPRPLTAKDKKK